MNRYNNENEHATLFGSAIEFEDDGGNALVHVPFTNNWADASIFVTNELVHDFQYIWFGDGAVQPGETLEDAEGRISEECAKNRIKSETYSWTILFGDEKHQIESSARFGSVQECCDAALCALKEFLVRELSK